MAMDRLEYSPQSWTTGCWLLQRFVPALFLSALLGAICGGLRFWGVFLVGVQGMIAGALLGWAAGRLGREDPDVWWSFSQRIWLSLSAALIFTVTAIMVLSAAKAALFDAPWEWIEDVLHGFQGEVFIGLKRYGSSHGYITGGFWVAFQLLDAGLLAFLFLALSVAGLTRKEVERSGPSLITPVAVEEMESFPSMEKKTIRAAFCGFGILLGSIVLLAGALWTDLKIRQDSANPFHGSNFNTFITKNKALVGRWMIADGHGLFSRGAEIVFDLQMAGFTHLAGKSVPEGRFLIDFENQMDRYRGKITRAGQIFWLPLRMQARPDGQEMTMVVEVTGAQGTRKINLVAQRKL